MVNLSNNMRLPSEPQILAFKWCQNIGDALSHLAHFGSFLSETQRQEAVNILKSYSKPHQDLSELAHYVHIAPINPDKPTIAKIQPSI